MAPQAAMQRRACQKGDRWLQRAEAVIQRQQRLVSEGDDDGFRLNREYTEAQTSALSASDELIAEVLTADPATIDTIEYCRLEGQSEPFLDQRVGFELDGVEFKIRHDFAAKAIDFRGRFFNAGV
jgi:hypothetical protein